ncbi:hypothetical protein OIU76_024369 [Salix suchowensis]|nr:hypothetical protein OIU76_024369 [Salix suchowensis]
MGFGALRNAIRPLSRIPNNPHRNFLNDAFFGLKTRKHTLFDRLTSTRFPKRRPVDKPRRKRASLKPPGPYAWVQYVPGEPIKPNNPNVGSVKRRNERKRIRQRQEFILVRVH